jgi:hypothetical protein
VKKSCVPKPLLYKKKQDFKEKHALGREKKLRTDLSQKTEGKTPTGKARKLLFHCQKTIKIGKN